MVLSSQKSIDFISFLDSYKVISNEIVIEFSNFFNRSIEKKKRINDELTNHYCRVLNVFFLKYKENKIQYDIENKGDAAGFNIFNILKFTRPEEQFHSRLLESLLDCSGKHGQADLFYKEFIKCILKEQTHLISEFINSDSKDYYIKREFPISTINNEIGKIDICIMSLNPNNKFCIIIENKWNSPDSSKDQIKKYWESLNEQGFKKNKILLVYLARHKRGAENISEEFREKLKTINYISISYENQIAEWLQNIQQVRLPNKITEIINQYLKYIKYERFIHQ